MRYLVTGGAGFIGSNLVRGLVEQGHQVRIIDDFSSGHVTNLNGIDADLEVIEGDITNLDTLIDATEWVDGVFHQAAIPAVPRSIKDPIRTNAVNVTGTLNLLEACRKNKVPRVVLASSSSVYGNVDADITHEGLNLAPCSPYAAQKLATEALTKAYTETMEVGVIALRYFNVFGPFQDPMSDYAAVIPAFVRRMLQGQRPIIFGDGLQSRDFTFVGDVVAANIASMQAPSEACGRPYNIACGRRTSLLELVQSLNTILGTELDAEHQDERAGDVKHSLADISRAQTSLSWAPEVSFEEGLRRTVEWIRGNS